MALRDKQERFVQEYLKDLNATQAAIRSGYSEKTAGAVGHENLKKPEIAAEIAKRQSEIGKENEITVEWLLGEMKSTYIEARREGEFSAANKSLEMLGKYKGMFSDRLELTGSAGGPLQVIFDADMSKGDRQ